MSAALVPSLPAVLYHGTSAGAIASIRRSGIIPRGADGARDNWRHTVGSNARAVYLSLCYGFYFAQCAARGDGDLAVIELATAPIESGLHADEDALEQHGRERDDLWQRNPEWSMKRRTIYYRSRAHLYGALGSLQYMGTCAHRGAIPAPAIRRIAYVERSWVMRIILAAHDPLISGMNFRVVGERHMQFHRWLFGDESECAACPPLTREGISVESINEEVWS